MQAASRTAFRRRRYPQEQRNLGYKYSSSIVSVDDHRLPQRGSNVVNLLEHALAVMNDDDGHPLGGNSSLSLQECENE